jgi:cysteine desulfurase
MLKQIYFDCNATTPTLADAQEAALQAMQSLFGNPSSSHMAGLQARYILESTRKKAAQIVGSLPDEIIFTSGATEAIQSAVFSALVHARDRGAPPTSTLLYGATEHKAVPQAMEHWVRSLGLPYAVKAIPADKNGQLDQAWLKKELPGAILVATMAVNNESGVIQDLAALHQLLSQHPTVFWLVDCVQGLGKLELDFKKLRVDYAPFSGHKLYAPKGIGFLYCRKRLVASLTRAFPKIQFNTPFQISVPTTINFSIPGFSSKELLDLFDSAGVRVSAGSACSSTAVTPSHVLMAMHLSEERAASAVRLSFGPATTLEEIEDGCEAIQQAAIALQGSCLLPGPGEFEAPGSCATASCSSGPERPIPGCSRIALPNNA